MSRGSLRNADVEVSLSGELGKKKNLRPFELSVNKGKGSKLISFIKKERGHLGVRENKSNRKSTRSSSYQGHW